jgi:hypothetical protein
MTPLRDDTRWSRPLDLQPIERGERLANELRRLVFVEGELGMPVEVSTPCHGIVEHRGDIHAPTLL